MIEKICREVERRIGRKVRERDIESILMAAAEEVDVWELIALSDVAQNVVEEALKVLKGKGLIKFNGKVRLTEAGKKIVKDRGFRDWRCKHCNGRGVEVFHDIAEEFFKIVRSRPRAVREFDQGYVVPEVTLARVAHMDMHGDVRGRRIIILGDDDLVSIALGLTGLPKEIVVVEIDRRLNDFIEKTAREYGFEVEFLHFDLRNPLPHHLAGRFDTFECDPTETLPGLKMFVGRGIAAVREGGAGYFGLTRIESDLWRWYEAQRIILELGAVITDIIPKFNWYENWDYYRETVGWQRMPESLKVPPKALWYNSAWYRVEVLKKKGWNGRIEGDPYTDELSSTV